MGDIVTVGTYLDPVEAEIACAALKDAGIRARVRSSANLQPLLADAGGGYRIDVPAADAEHADEVLRAVRARAQQYRAEDDDEPDATVRCPRCELAYCSFGRPRFRIGGPMAIVNPFVLAAALVTRLGKERWACDKCEHTWTDAPETPTKFTRLPEGEPHPVFRLRRTRAGMGVFVGTISGLALMVMIGVGVSAVAIPVGALGGWALGTAMRRDVCSKLECRTPLQRGARECPTCHGVVAGEVGSAPEHYAAAAAYRRELSAALAADEQKRRRRSKRAKA